MEQMQEAIQRLPGEDASAYLEALASVPDLVEKESNPEAFLLCEGGNVDRASQRLANYWKERKGLFKDRAFFPMDASGEGTLTTEDVEHTKSGFFVFLPPDSFGHPVVFSDTHRATFGVAGNGSIRPRIRFYFFNRVAMEYAPATQTEGIVLLRLMKYNTQFANRTGFELEHLLLRCLPLKVFSVHICCCSDSVSSSVTSKMVLPSVLQKLGKGLASKAQAHLGTGPSDFYERLKQHGFQEESLPTSLGGKMAFEDLNKWRRVKEEMSTKLAAISAGMPAQESPSALGTIPSLLQFVLGTLVMLEDKKKMKLVGLLRETKTQDILKGLLKPLKCSSGVTNSCDLDSTGVDSNSSNPERKRKFETDDISPSARREALLEKIRAVREDNAKLRTSIGKKLTTTAQVTKGDLRDSPFSYVPGMVQFVLGILATLEEKRSCELRDLLADAEVQLILRGLLGSPEVSS